MITGRSDSGQRSRSWRSTSMPERPGIMTSSSTRSKACCSIRASARSPSSAMSTAKPRPPEPPREHVAVELVVVDDQQAHAARGRSAPASGARTGARGTVGSSTPSGTGGGSGSRNTTRWARGRGRRHDLVHRFEGPARRLADLPEVGEELLLARVADLVLEQLRVADDLVQRGAKVVPQPGPRVDLRVAHGRGSLTPPRSGHVRSGGGAGGRARPPAAAGPPGGPKATRSTRECPPPSGPRRAGPRAAAWSGRARP